MDRGPKSMGEEYVPAAAGGDLSPRRRARDRRQQGHHHPNARRLTLSPRRPARLDLDCFTIVPVLFRSEKKRRIGTAVVHSYNRAGNNTGTMERSAEYVS